MNNRKNDKSSERHPYEDSTFSHHEPCPQCQRNGGDWNGDNLARYSDGHGFCHVCGYYETAQGGSGRMDRQKDPVPFDPVPVDAFMALKARGITQETCEHFGYGIGKAGGKYCHIAPLYDHEGILVAQHLRFEGKEFRWRGSASEAVLFGQTLWRRGGRKVIVTEGEIDCLSISQLQGNKWPVVSLPNGSSSGAKYIRASLEWLESFDEVVFAFDMDEPGQKAAKECALLLSPGKAKIARLPMKDANECLVAGKGKELIDALWGAVPYRPDGIRSGAELWEDIKKPPPAGYEIPYPGLNGKLGGVRLGELVLFTAGSGIGKSTIVNEIAYHLMMTHGLTLGVMALEENPARNARRYLGIHLNKPLHLPAAHASVPEADLKAAFDAVMGNGKWYIYDHFGSSDIDTLLSKLRYLAVGLDCKAIVLDHISIVVSGLDESEGESERKIIDKLMTRLRSLIEETGILVLAVVHLKRPDKGKSYNEGRPVSLTDLRGSGSLEQVSDVVVSLERDQQGDEPDTATIRVLKNRPLGITGLAGTVRYDRETGRLLPCDDGDGTGGAAYGFQKEETPTVSSPQQSLPPWDTAEGDGNTKEQPQQEKEF